MHVAVFTPTHDTRHLADCARSVAYQTAAEHGVTITWWIGANNGAQETARDVAASVLGERMRFHVHVLDLGTNRSVGALKRRLCDAAIAAGADVLVELDHDDVLHPDAIREVVHAVESMAAAGEPSVMVYSGFAEFRDQSNAPHAYSADYGWRSHVVTADAPGTSVDRASLVAMRPFRADPRSLCQIGYAPNHLRAWTASAYQRAGGHDPALDVCDDHDLLIRTYLAGVHFVALQACLYYYRLAANTYAGPANAKIQAMSGVGVETYPNGARVPDFAARVTLRDRHLHALIVEWVRRTRTGGAPLPMLDLGGGVGREVGGPWTVVDLRNADVRRDLRRGLPYADGSVSVIRAVDFLEHLDPEDAAFLIGECWRVLCHGGWLLTRTPADHGVGAACDLSHRSRWNTRTWAYFWSPALRPYRDSAFPMLDPAVMFRPVRILTESATMGPPPCQWEVPYVVADLQVDKHGDLPGPRFG